MSSGGANKSRAWLGLDGQDARPHTVARPPHFHTGVLLAGAELKFAGGGSSAKVRLDQHRGIGEQFFVDLHAHLGVALGVGQDLRVVGWCVGPGEAEGEASAFDSRATISDPDLQG